SKVEAALTEVDGWIQRHSWPQAKAAATRARELRESGASDHWQRRVNETLTDLNLVLELDDVLLRQAEFDTVKKRFPRDDALPRYAAAFQRSGLPVGTEPPRTAAHIAGRPAPIRDAIVAGLDNWLLLSLRHNDPAHVWLTAVLQ